MDDRSVALDRRTSFREILIIGGGCYGTFYSTQLATALTRGKIVAESIVLVDRDPGCQASRHPQEAPFRLEVAEWGSFLDHWLDRRSPNEGEPDDAIVPSPLMPHLMAEWLERQGPMLKPPRHVHRVPVERPLRTPYDVAAPDGNRYVSFADWLCPTHCIEPHICPVIRGPRTWEMGDAVTDYVKTSNGRLAGPALFTTRHRAFGVGMFDVAEARAARSALVAATSRPGSVDLVVATISACHGAISVLRVEPDGA